MKLDRVLWACVACLAATCAEPPARQSDGAPVSRRLPRAAWVALASKRVFFGHQSVGENIMQGVSDLARADSGLGIRVAEGPDALSDARGVFAHARIGRNGEPGGKTDAFAGLLAGSRGRRADIAFHKYCYADIVAGTDVDTVFAHYRAIMAGLRAEHPGVTFVHVTVPLARVQSGPKALIKRLLGRGPGRFESNLARERFNDLLRRAYGGREPLFDLASVECTRPDGRAETARFGGRSVRSLVASYTDDGAHLNGLGRRRVAGELLVFLAGLPAPGARIP